MESKQDKIDTLHMAIKHLIDGEKRSYKEVSITDRDKEIDHRLLSRLLSQLKALREDDLLQEDSVTKTSDDNERRTMDLPEPAVVQPKKKKKKASVKKESSCVNEQGEYKMSNDNQAQDVSEGQSASQPPSSGNFNHSPQTPFIPITPMQYPQAGPFAQWLSNPSNLHFQNHQNPYAAFSGPTPSQNPPYYQQNFQSQPVFQTLQNSNPYQPAFQTTPPPTVASTSGSKNWTLEEDLQLCRAWVKVIEDGKKKNKLWDDSTGGGQKKDKLWDRVRDTFHKLMNEVYGKESVRNSGGCENRMRDLKTQCSKWTEIRTKAYHQRTASGSNLIDSESLARQMWEDENNGKPFRHMACWNVLKECPVWNDPVKKPSDKNPGSTSQPCVGAPPEPINSPLPLPLPELSHPHTAINKDKSHTPITPITITEENNTRVLTENQATCTPILNSPTSKDIEPLGQKKKRKKQKLSDAQETASRTFRAGLTSLQADVNARWEKSREDQRRRDDRNKRVLREEMRMQAQLHDLDLATKRSDIIDKITASGEKLILAIKKLDEIGADSVLTPNQKLQYEVRQRAVALHKKQYTELNESLERTEFQSPPCTNSVLDSPRAVGTSDEANNLEDE